MEITLALIKPHAYRNPSACRYIGNLIVKNFTILEGNEIMISKEDVEQLYMEHKQRFFYNRLVSAMTSGPCFGLILFSQNSIMKWRSLMGNTKVFEAVYQPDSIRSLYGLSDTRNSCHGADSIQSAEREIDIFFPNFRYKNNEIQGNKHFLS